ncbi:MAG: class I SAM-dependent methyltransferase [Terriglobales bacterium]
MRLLDYYHLSAVLRRLRRASVADMRRWISTLPAIALAPRPNDITTAICGVFPGTTRVQADALQTELATDQVLHSSLDSAMRLRRGRLVQWQEWHPFLYAAVRVHRPNLVLETGVFDGLSSAVILRAMERNTIGELVSIDLPARKPVVNATDRMPEGALPEGCPSGWIVPDYLRSRYRLNLGDSRDLLPRILETYRHVDIFLHDSLHTYGHQRFEYNSVWPYLTSGGLLLSDDIFWSAAFHRFCRKHGLRYVNAGKVGGFGAARKPGNAAVSLAQDRTEPVLEESNPLS